MLQLGLAEEAPTPRLDDVEREYEETVARLIERDVAIPDEENASRCYLRAIAALPKTENEELDEFLWLTMPLASPGAMDELPGAREEIRKYEEAVTRHLRRGAGMNRCAFGLDWRSGAQMPLPGYAGVRELARRAVCYGKLLESEGKKAEAARVYLDVIRMGLHVAQDSSPIPMVVGIAVARLSGPAIEGILSRGVDAETARFLLDGLRSLPTPYFRPSRAADVDRVLFTGWVREEHLKVAEKGREEFVRALKIVDAGRQALQGRSHSEHKPWVVPEDTREIKRQLIEAFDVLDRQLKLLSSAMEEPYHKARPQVERLTKAQKSYWQGEIAEGHLGGIVGEFCGTAPALHVMDARADARLRALQILAAACLAKAETGKYPKSLEALKKYFPMGLPKDPFTGKDFTYWLHKGMPHLTCEGDDPQLRKKRPQTYVFGLAYRRMLEKWELDKWRARRDRTPREEGSKQD